MLSDREVSAAIGTTAYDADGGKIGTVEHFFVDDRTGLPSWVAVTTGLFGGRTTLVPVQSAGFADGRLVLPVSKDAIRSAPEVGRDGRLGPDDEVRLRRHYGLEPAGTGEPAWAPSDTGLAPAGAAPSDDGAATPEPAWTPSATGLTPAGAGTGDDDAQPPWAPSDTGLTPAGAAAAETRPEPAGSGRHAWRPSATGLTPAGADPADEVAASGPELPAAAVPDGSMVRTEERLRVGTESVPAKRVRVVKYVVTEEVQITVPVRREEIRIEEVPFDAADDGPGEFLVPAAVGPAGEIILHTERPVVTVEVVPTERVHVRTELVEGQEQVTGQVQREQILVDQQPPLGAGQ